MGRTNSHCARFGAACPWQKMARKRWVVGGDYRGLQKLELKLGGPRAAPPQTPPTPRWGDGAMGVSCSVLGGMRVAVGGGIGEVSVAPIYPVMHLTKYGRHRIVWWLQDCKP